MVQLISSTDYYSGRSTYGSSSYDRSSAYDRTSSSYKPSKKEIPPKEYIFNKDDILLFLIAEIDRAQRSCSNHDSCVRADKNVIERRLNSFLNEKDPIRGTLSDILDELESDEVISTIDFDDITAFFEKNGYQTTPPTDLESKIRKEWNKIVEKRARARTTRDPKITNEADLKKKFRTTIEDKRDKGYGYKEMPTKKEEKNTITNLIGKFFGG
jgi:hypothetical protein